MCFWYELTGAVEVQGAGRVELPLRCCMAWALLLERGVEDGGNLMREGKVRVM